MPRGVGMSPGRGSTRATPKRAGPVGAAESALGRARLSGTPRQGAWMREVQRSRLVAGAVGAIDELGYPQASIGRITTRSGVSRRTFYDMFANRDECFAAVLGEAAIQVEGELAAAGLERLPWRERVRTGLWTILAFFDREPALARACVIQALRAGPPVLERREEILARLAAIVDGGRTEGARGENCTPLTAEGVIGAAFAIVHSRLPRGEGEQLRGLLGELMAMIVLPYLGPAAARQERARPAPTAPAALVSAPRMRATTPRPTTADPLAGVNLRLTHRTARVLVGVAELRGRGSAPSNREVATVAGVTDPGQISKLLHRLERLGLLVNTGQGHAKGEPNAWMLTATGERVTQSIRMHASNLREAA